MTTYYKLYEKDVLISASARHELKLDMEVLSFDKNVDKLILNLQTDEKLELEGAEVTFFLTAVLPNRNRIQLEESGTVEDATAQKISYIVSEKLRGFEGTVTSAAYLRLKTGQNIDIQNIKFKMQRSLIDSVNVDVEPFYFETFEKIRSRVDAEAEKAKLDMSVTVAGVETTAVIEKEKITSIKQSVKAKAESSKQEMTGLVNDVNEASTAEKDRLFLSFSETQKSVEAKAGDSKQEMTQIVSDVEDVATDEKMKITAITASLQETQKNVENKAEESKQLMTGLVGDVEATADASKQEMSDFVSNVEDAAVVEKEKIINLTNQLEDEFDVFIEEKQTQYSSLDTKADALNTRLDTVDQKQRKLLETLDNSDVITKEQFVRFLAGEEIELTFTEDLSGENLHEFKTTQYSGLVAPASGSWTKLQNASELLKLKSLDGAVYTKSERYAAGYMQQGMFLWNLIDRLNERLPGVYGIVGANDITSKVAFFKKIISGNIDQRCYGLGSGPSGNRLDFTTYLPETDRWQTGEGQTQVNSTASIKMMSEVNSSDIIGADGIVKSIAYAEAADGTTPSSISIDYASITYKIKLKLSNFLKPKKAWAWNDNGTERFTGCYPRENLLKGSKLTETKYEWNRLGYLFLVPLNTPIGDYGLKIGDILNYQADRVTRLETDDKKRLYLAIIQKNDAKEEVHRDVVDISNGTDKKIQLSTTIVPNAKSLFVAWTQDNATAIGKMSAFGEKIYVGETSNNEAWTPSPSEDALGAIPPYTGTSVIASKDPSNYAWARSNEYIDFMFSQMPIIEQPNNLADRASALEP